MYVVYNIAILVCRVYCYIVRKKKCKTAARRPKKKGKKSTQCILAHEPEDLCNADARQYIGSPLIMWTSPIQAIYQ